MNKNLKISVITVVYNDPVNIKKTIDSVRLQKKLRDFEYIIMDGSSSDGTIDVIQRNIDCVDVFVSQKDKGLYDAMNKGLDRASGDGILFLNAGDILHGDVLRQVKNIPCFLPVKYFDYFGNYKKVKIKSEKKAMSNCHQGIIFLNNEIRYDIDYKISADYDFFLKHGLNNDTRRVDTFGWIHFDVGLSDDKYKLRDREIFRIRKKYFGYVTAIYHEIEPALKRTLRKIKKRKEIK